MKEGKNRPVNPHRGHRLRVEEKFLRHGLDRFAPHEVLELVLFFVIRRGDTNELAHRLIDKFGSLSGVFDAPYEELLQIKGVGRITALFLKLVPAVCRRYMADSLQGGQRICEAEEAFQVLQKKYIGMKNEIVVLMLLDSQSKMILCETVNEGSVNMAPIYIRRIVELAVRYNASAVILSHNHPSGNPVPSRGDLDSTREVAEALRTVGVPLRDHIIVGREDFVSMAHVGLLKDIFGEE